MPQIQKPKFKNAYEAIHSKLDQTWIEYQLCRSSCCKAPKIKVVHDLRTTLRRLVAIIDLAQELPLSAKTSKFRKELKQVLDTLRDLRDLQNQEKDLGKKLGPDKLQEFQYQLQINRKQEQKNVKSCLRKVNWKKLDSRYQVLEADLLSAAKNPELTKQAEPIPSNALENRFQNFESCAQQALPPSPPSFHRARIEFKKFRYAWEAMSGIYPLTREMAGQIKEVQNILGKIQDASVLIKFFYEFLVDYKETDPNSDLIRFIRSVEKEQEDSMQYFVSNKRRLLSQIRPHTHRGEHSDEKMTPLTRIGTKFAPRSA